MEVGLSGGNLVVGSAVGGEAGEDVGDKGGGWAVAVGVGVGAAAFAEEPCVQTGWENVWDRGCGDCTAGRGGSSGENSCGAAASFALGADGLGGSQFDRGGRGAELEGGGSTSHVGDGSNFSAGSSCGRVDGSAGLDACASS